MKKTITSILLCLTILFSSSCATILTGTKQKVTFKSNVNGKVFQNLAEIGKTNEVIKIKRHDLTKLYTIKADGFQDKQFELPVRSNPVFYLNILFGVFVTGYFDLATGAIIKTDKEINVTVEKSNK